MSLERAELEHNTSFYLMAHPKGTCLSDESCVLHNRTEHSMRAFPQHWRDDRGFMERICPHGIGHPDPDGMAFIRRTQGEKNAYYEGIHGCDGCCAPAR